MRKIIGISIVVFGSFIIAVFAAGLYGQGNTKTLVAGDSTASSGLPSLPSDSPLTAPLIALNTSSNQSGQNNQSVLSASEVAKHNSVNDCWMIINGGVYDVTKALSSHPGGVSVMIPYCGKDGTQAFLTKDKNPASNHSQPAVSMLAPYFVGKLNQPRQLASAQSPAKTNNPQQNNLPPVVTRQPTLPPTLPPTVPPTTPPVSSVILTAAEVSKHKSASDCWSIISNKVYDLTSYLGMHPGGASAIIPYCGGDATVAFQTKGGQGQHSPAAYSMLAAYYVGDLGATTTAQQPTSNIPPAGNTQTTPTPTPGIVTQPPPIGDEND